MKVETRKMIILAMLFSILLMHAASATEYESLKGVKSAKAVFDIRISQPKVAALHLNILHQAYKDLRESRKKPDFKIIFSGPSVKLISKSREGFSMEEQKSLEEIANTISAASKDGIDMEICMVAARVFNVDPATLLPEIKKVENGWISLIGYEANGYALVPAY